MVILGLYLNDIKILLLISHNVYRVTNNYWKNEHILYRLKIIIILVVSIVLRTVVEFRLKGRTDIKYM